MRNENDSVLFWIGLSSIPGVGKATFRKLVSHFGSPRQALAAGDDLVEVDGLSRKIVEAIHSYPWRDYAEQEIEKAAAADVRIVTLDDASYPSRLRSIPDPPLYLYVKGSLPALNGDAVAIVGTRSPTHYGRTTAYRLAAEIAAAGWNIVSGMARGIDTQAHRGALAAKGKTIAVLACGIDVVYPPENAALAKEIVQSGAIVTENPFGTKPEAGYFPARNRIISGLAQGTVIIEATEDSGSLITAQYAIDHGRKLFAVPANIGSAASRGAHGLIKRGAALIEGAEDVLKALCADGAGRRAENDPAALPPMTPAEESVFRCITGEPKHIDTIMNEARISPGLVSGILVALELKGLAKQLRGKYFVREG